MRRQVAAAVEEEEEEEEEEESVCLDISACLALFKRTAATNILLNP
jgi:hypothetical protein